MTNWHKFADTWNKVTLKPEKFAQNPPFEPELSLQVAFQCSNDLLHQELIHKTARLHHDETAEISPKLATKWHVLAHFFSEKTTNFQAQKNVWDDGTSDMKDRHRTNDVKEWQIFAWRERCKEGKLERWYPPSSLFLPQIFMSVWHAAGLHS